MTKARGEGIAMGGDLGAALAVVMVIAGLALLVSAGYFYDVALPQEHAPKHVITRSSLAIAGIALVLLGSGSLR